MSEYDSGPDTRRHIDEVQRYLERFIEGLEQRAEAHDKSKLEPPEKEAFDRATPELKGLTYGSPEYKAATARLGEALKHHYSVNSHHPEHYEFGLGGMDLLDIVEMICDWKAATKRHDDGDMDKSLEINRVRFEMSDQLYFIIQNTIARLKW